MCRLGMLLITVLITGCSSTRLTESWRNPEYNTFKPKNILVIGVTPNLKARTAFEFQLKRELNARQINALQSTVVFEDSFQDSRQTETEIEVQVDKLISAGYDTVLVSLVKGEEVKKSYSSESPKTDYHLRKFIGYYLAYQEAYFKQDYYKSYKVFHIETSIYNLKKDSEKALVWSGTYDLVDPSDVIKTIKGYVSAVIKTLEKEKLVPKKDNI